jgi:uncharacterized protein (DUF2345 family)
VRVVGTTDIQLGAGQDITVDAQNLNVDAGTATFTTGSFGVTAGETVDMNVDSGTARVQLDAGTCTDDTGAVVQLDQADCTSPHTWTEGVQISSTADVNLQGGDVDITATTGTLELSGAAGITMRSSNGPIDISSHETSSTIGATMYNSAGTLNDAVFGGYYTGTTNGDLVVRISDANPVANAFQWSFGGGVFSSDVTITAGVPMLLTDGVSVTFDHNVGHDGAETWTTSLTHGVGAPTTVAGTSVTLEARAGNLVASAANVAQVTADQVAVSAQQDVTVTSSAGDISLTAAEHIEMTATAGQATINAATGLSMLVTGQCTDSTGAVVTPDANLDGVTTEDECRPGGTGTNVWTAGDATLEATSGTVSLVGSVVDIDATNGAATLDATGPVTITATETARLTGADVEIESSTGSVTVTAGDEIRFTATDGTVSLAGSDGVTVDSSGGAITLTAATDIGLQSLDTVTVAGSDRVSLNAGTDMHLATTGACVNRFCDCTGVDNLACDTSAVSQETCEANGGTWTEAAVPAALSAMLEALQDHVLDATELAELQTQCSAGGNVWNAAGSVTIDAEDGVTLTSDSGAISIEATDATNGDISLTAGTDITLTGGSKVEMRAQEDILLESTAGGVTVIGGGGVLMEATAGDLEVETDSTLTIDGKAGTIVQSDSGPIEIKAATDVSVTSMTSQVTLEGSLGVEIFAVGKCVNQHRDCPALDDPNTIEDEHLLSCVVVGDDEEGCTTVLGSEVEEVNAPTSCVLIPLAADDPLAGSCVKSHQNGWGQCTYVPFYLADVDGDGDVDKTDCLSTGYEERGHVWIDGDTTIEASDKLTLSAQTGEVKIEAEAGSIVVDAQQGGVEVTSASSTVKLLAETDVELVSATGNVEVYAGQTAGDVDIKAQEGTVRLDGAGVEIASTDAMTFSSVGAATLTSATSITLDAQGSYFCDCTDVTNPDCDTSAASQETCEANGGTWAGGLKMTSEQDLQLTSTAGDVVIDGSTGVSIEAGGPITMDATGGSATITATEAVTIESTGSDATFQATGELKIESTGGDVDISAQNAMTIASVDGNIGVSAATNVDVVAGNTLSMVADSQMSLEGVAGVDIESRSGDIGLTSSANVRITASTGDVTMTAHDDMRLEATTTATLSGDAGVAISSRDGPIQLNSGDSTTVTSAQDISLTSASGGITVNSQDDILMTSSNGAVEVEAGTEMKMETVGHIALQAGDTSLEMGTVCAPTHAALCAASQESGVDSTACDAVVITGNVQVCDFVPGTSNTLRSCVATDAAACSQLVLTGDNAIDQQACSDQGECTLLVKQMSLKSNAMSMQTTSGPIDMQSAEDFNIGAGANIGLTATNGPVTIEASDGTLGLTAGQDVSLTSDHGTMTLTADTEMQMTAGTDLTMVAGGAAVIGSSRDMSMSATHGQMHMSGVGLRLAATGGTCLDGVLPVSLGNEGDCVSAGHTWVPSAYVTACSAAQDLSACDAVVGHEGVPLCEFIEACSVTPGTLEQEAVAVTTCALSEAVAGGAAGMCALDTGSGSCAYVSECVYANRGVTIDSSAGSVAMTAGSTVSVEAAGGIDLTSSAGPISIDANGAAGLSIETTAGPIALTATSGDVSIGATGNLDLESDASTTMHTAGNLELGSGGAFVARSGTTMELDAGTGGTGDLTMTSGGTADINAGGQLTLNGHGLEMNANGGDMKIESSNGDATIVAQDGITVTSSASGESRLEAGASSIVATDADIKVTSRAMDIVGATRIQGSSTEFPTVTISLDRETTHIETPAGAAPLFGFSNLLDVGDVITVGNEIKTIVSVQDENSATVDSEWTQDSSDTATFSYQKSIFAISDSTGQPVLHVDTDGAIQLSRGEISTAPGTNADLTMTSVEGDVSIEAHDNIVMDGNAGVQLQVDGETTLEVDATGTFVRNSRFSVAGPDGVGETLSIDANGQIVVSAGPGQDVSIGTKDTTVCASPPCNAGDVRLAAGDAPSGKAGDIIMTAARGHTSNGNIAFYDAEDTSQPRVEITGDGAVSLNAATAQPLSIMQDDDVILGVSADGSVSLSGANRDGDGTNVDITGGDAGTGTGGDVTLMPGTGATPGSVAILDGLPDSTPRVEVTGDGTVNLVGRDNLGTAGVGTDVTIRGGSGAVDGAGGSVVLSPGGGTTPGAVHITDAIDDTPRVAVTADGAVTMEARSAVGDDDDGQSILITAGDGGAVSGSGGDIELRPGNADTPGQVVIMDATDTVNPRVKVDGSGSVDINAAAGQTLTLGQGDNDVFTIAADGTVTLTSEDSDNTGRDVLITAGDNVEGSGGSIYFRPGLNGETVLQDSNSEPIIRILGDGTIHMTENIYMGQQGLGERIGLHVDATTNRVGVHTDTPGADLDVNGDATVRGALTVDGDTLHVDPGSCKDSAGAALPVLVTQVACETAAVDNVWTAAGNVGIGTLTPETTLDVQARGLTGNMLDLVQLTNTATGNSGTRTAMLFKQAYQESDGSASESTRPSARVTVGTEEDWLSDATTRNSYMAFETAYQGVVAEQVIIGSNGDMQTKGDFTVGGDGITGDRTLTVDSVDGDASLRLVSGDATKDAVLTFEDGASTMSIGKDDQDLKIKLDGAERATFTGAGDINFDTGAGAEFRISQDSEARFLAAGDGSVSVTSAASQPVAITAGLDVDVESLNGRIELTSSGTVASCVEAAPLHPMVPGPSVPDDAEACAAVTDLVDGVACAAVHTQAGASGACLYTAAVDATLDMVGGTGVRLESLENDVHITAASQVILTATAGKVQMQAGHAVEIGSSAGGVALSSATAMDLRSGGSATLTAGGAVAVLSEGSSCLDFKAVEVGSCTDSNGDSVVANAGTQRLWVPQIECMTTEGNTWVATYSDFATCTAAGTCLDAGGNAVAAASSAACTTASGTYRAHRWLGGLLESAEAMMLSSSSTVTVSGEDSVTLESTLGPVELKATGASGSVEITGQTSVEVRAATAGIDVVAGGAATLTAGTTMDLVVRGGRCVDAAGAPVDVLDQDACVGTNVWHPGSGTCRDANGAVVDTSAAVGEGAAESLCNQVESQTWAPAGTMSMSSRAGAMTLSAATEMTIESTGSTASVTGGQGVSIASTNDDIDISAAAGAISVQADTDARVAGATLALTATDGPVTLAATDGGAGPSCVSPAGAVVAAADQTICESGTQNKWLHAGSVTLSGETGVTVSSDANIDLTAASGSVSMTATTGDVGITGNAVGLYGDNMEMVAASNVDINAFGNLQLRSGGVCQDGTGALVPTYTQA